MKNPYRADDAVITMVKGKKIEALVIQTWNNEVQVKTVDGDLLWRTMYTVWYPGEEPLERTQSSAVAKEQPATKRPAKKAAATSRAPKRSRPQVKRRRR